MIQRIQTVYLLICVILSASCIAFEIMSENYPWALTVIMAISLVIEFMAIFLFRRRATQMRFCTFSMILQVGWYAVLVAIAELLGNEECRLHLWEAIPAINFILLYLAFRAILKDELLVKSLDRLR